MNFLFSVLYGGDFCGNLNDTMPEIPCPNVDMSKPRISVLDQTFEAIGMYLNMDDKDNTISKVGNLLWVQNSRDKLVSIHATDLSNPEDSIFWTLANEKGKIFTL